MDRYATHQQPLIEAALEAKHGILELGCGHYSTPLLKAIAAHKGIAYLCQASDQGWASQFEGAQIVDWASWEPPAGHWDMIFLDSEESTKNRIKRLPALAKVANVVVMHDADAAMVHNNFDKYIGEFARVKWYKTHRPWTLILYQP